jgi:hypothetical protein
MGLRRRSLVEQAEVGERWKDAGRRYMRHREEGAGMDRGVRCEVVIVPRGLTKATFGPG